MTYQNLFVDGKLCDVTVENGTIQSVEPSHNNSDKPKRIALPGIANLHTHSAMTLLRSAGSGLPLFRWLNEAIFPREAKLTPELIHQGALDACTEMRGTGTTAFNDMYFSIESTVRAACETALDANIALSVTDNDFDNGDPISKFLESSVRAGELLQSQRHHGKITLSIAPHAIYTVSGRHLQYLADFAKEHGTLFHMHLSETQKEREDCIREHGVPPVIYLERLGIFDKVGSRFIGAHSLWLDPTEIKVMGDHKVTAVHCPNSNLKLGSGCRFLYTELRDAGVNVALGTDGCASSDNLDMIEAMKVMSLLQKGTRNDPSVLPAEEVLKVATANGRRALGLPDNTIKAGNRASFFIADLGNRHFKGVDFSASPEELHAQLLDRLIYSANGSVVSETIV